MLNHTIVRVSCLQDLTKAFEGGLIQTYQDIFAEPPYEEYFSDNNVIQIFSAYFNANLKNQMLPLAYLDSQAVAFCAAVPFETKFFDFEVVDENNQISRPFSDRYLLEAFGLSSDNTWYLDDLGVRRNQRRMGLGKHLVQTCLTALEPVNMLLRTSESNLSAQSFYKNLGFSVVNGHFVMVSQERLDGTIREDRRIIMLRKTEHCDR